MKIAYVTATDAKNLKSWSGLGYFIWKALADRNHKLEFIGPLELPSHVRRLAEIKTRFHARFFKTMYIPDHDMMVARAYAREVEERLSALSGIDLVFSPGTIPVAALRGKVPMVVYADATHRLLFSTYPAYKHLSRLNHRHGDLIETKAHLRASALIFASQWAADSAVRDYATDPAKVHVVPFGANLEKAPEKSQIEQIIQNRDRGQLRLIFIGVEWERKGGPVALEVTRNLINLGIPTHLTVIGCSPQIAEADRKHVTLSGFMGKEGKLENLLREEIARSHFLILPSIAECFGVVYCEASAFGVPSVARNVGGVATAVRDGRNGRLFPPAASSEEIAAWMASVFRDYENYRKMALSTFAEYEEHLNWKVSGEKLEKIIEKAL
jgi:glycosyltransferase involved in cell wall biosynthesis